MELFSRLTYYLYITFAQKKETVTYGLKNQNMFIELPPLVVPGSAHPEIKSDPSTQHVPWLIKILPDVMHFTQVLNTYGYDLLWLSTNIKLTHHDINIKYCEEHI